MAESTLLPEVLQEAITGQITVERTNASVYAQLDIVFRKMAWFGMAKWANKSSHDETMHSEKFIDYLDDRNYFPDLDEIPVPEAVDYTNPMPVFIAALELEKATTKRINDLYLLADDENDIATCVFLQWFVTEQVDSEKEILDIINELQHGSTDAAYLAMIDEELGK
jgi:Ferritin-like protein